MGHRGCAKSTLARAFREILLALETAETTPFVEVPLGTSEDRLLGSIDASRLLENGEWSAQIGLIQQANGGVLYIDEVNLLPDHLVDSILDSAASGQHRIERDGLSKTVSARYMWTTIWLYWMGWSLRQKLLINTMSLKNRKRNLH